MKAAVPLLTLFLTLPLHAAERTTSGNPLPLFEPTQTIEEKTMDLRKKRCVPCEGGVKPLAEEEENTYAKLVPKWEIHRDGTHKIERSFVFKNFREAITFVTAIAEIAEEENHHPNLRIVFNRVVVELYTHAINGLSENDFIVAAKIDEKAQKKNRRGTKV